MIALDTNVLVRLVTRDDAEQTERARTLARDHLCVVPVTVLLEEMAWVLRRYADGDQRLVARQIRQVLGYPSIHVEHAPAVAQALDDAEAGMDLADAFHRAFAADAERLVTFDRRFVDAAVGRTGLPVDLL